MALALMVESAAVAAVLSLSILRIQPLVFRPPERLPAAPAPRAARAAPVQIVASSRGGASARLTAPVPRPFRAPVRTAQEVRMVEGPAPGISASGVPAGAGAATGPVPGLPFGSPAPPPPPPAPVPGGGVQPAKLYRIGGDVLEARLVRKVVPEYPEIARRARVSGTVHLTGVIAKDGSVRSLEIRDGHPLLARAAVEAVRQWIYRPTLLNGEPVEVIAPIEVRFVLHADGRRP